MPKNKDFEDFILSMLSKDLDKRLSLQEILEHPWYCGKTNNRKKSCKEIA